jgi:hypothetical protein
MWPSSAAQIVDDDTFDNHQAIYAIWFTRELREHPLLQNFWHPPPKPSVSRQNGVSFIETLYFVLLYRVADESHGHSLILSPVFTLKTSASCQQCSNFCSLQYFPVQSGIHIFQPTSRIQLPLPPSPSPSSAPLPSLLLPPFKAPCVLKIAESSTASLYNSHFFL